MKKIIIIIICVVAMFSNATFATGAEEEAYLVTHEPNLVGITYDYDDQEFFMDFKVSMEYPLFRDTLRDIVCTYCIPRVIRKICSNFLTDSCYPYFSFTGRFGQYLISRDSAPVIGKRFNPKFFIRLEKESYYLDLEYAHESNGQRITTYESYSTLAVDLARKDKDEHANDYISRGWDYVGFTLHYSHPLSSGEGNALNVLFSYSKYIDGYLQSGIEEYYEWERERKIEAREEVNGWKLSMVVLDRDSPINKIGLTYETGIKDPFKYNTGTVEISTESFGIPITIWGRKGYNSDLAQYYKKVDSVGIAFELTTFKEKARPAVKIQKEGELTGL